MIFHIVWEKSYQGKENILHYISYKSIPCIRSLDFYWDPVSLKADRFFFFFPPLITFIYKYITKQNRSQEKASIYDSYIYVTFIYM